MSAATEVMPTVTIPVALKTDRRLRRRVGPFALTAFSLGSVLGATWLVAGPLAARIAGPASLVSWAVAAFMLFFLALVYAELSATYPVSGGTARYSFLCFGPLAGFAAGWASWLQAVTIGPIETEIAINYLEPQWSGLVTPSGLLTEKGVGVAIAFMVFFTLINLAGIRFLAGLNHLGVYWKLAVPVITIAALAATSFHTSNFYSAGGFAPFGAQSILRALPLGGVVLAMFGFEQAAQVGGEAREPRGHLPTAIISSLLIVAVVYILLQAAYIGAVDPSHLTSPASWLNPVGGAIGPYGPYARLATTLGVGWVATLIYIDAVVSPGGKAMLYVSSTSRITYSMSRARTSPNDFERLDRRGTPWFSIVLAAMVGVLIFLPFSGWSRLIDFLAGATAFMYAFAPVSLAALRRSDPDRYRPFKLPAADVLAPVAFVFANLIIYWTGWPTVWRISVAIAIGGVLFFVGYLTTPSVVHRSLKLRSAAWLPPWLLGILVLDALGPAYVSGARHVIPFWWDLGIVAGFSLAIFYLSQWLALPSSSVAANVVDADVSTSEEDVDFGLGG